MEMTEKLKLVIRFQEFVKIIFDYIKNTSMLPKIDNEKKTSLLFSLKLLLKKIFSKSKSENKYNEIIFFEEVEKIKNVLPKLEQALDENLSNYFQFLSEQENGENYIEIHWPFFEFGITLMLSKIKGKLLISILNHKDSVVYGNLLIEGFDCLGSGELKKLGWWQNYSEKKLKILKPF